MKKFKEGDIVWHPQYKWGKVLYSHAGVKLVEVEFKSRTWPYWFSDKPDGQEAHVRELEKCWCQWFWKLLF